MSRVDTRVPSEQRRETREAPRSADEAESADRVASAVAQTEIVEPIRVGEKAGDAAPEDIAFANPTSGNVLVSIPERRAIPAGKASRLPAGYHRAIHRQAPQLVCEHGKRCPVLYSVRGESTPEQWQERVYPAEEWDGQVRRPIARSARASA